MSYRRAILIGLALWPFVYLWGCTTALFIESNEVRPRPMYVADVPFFPQEKYQCGPASLAAVLTYWGQDTSPEEIAGAIYLPRLKGSLNIDLWRYATARGFDAQIQEGSLEFLETQLQDGRPVIAFLNLGFRFFPVGHFLVVVGLDPHQQAVIAHSGTEKEKRIPYKKFLASWKKTRYWSLKIKPKES